MRLTGVVDWKRMLLAAPLLVVVALAAWLLLSRGADASTPRAALVDTPAAAGGDVGVHKGQLSRDFLGTAPGGATVRLSELRGQPTIINFWATWCSSCLAELPEFKALQQELGTENLHIVAVNAGEDSRTAQDFLDFLDVPQFRVAMDPTLVVSDAYGVYGMPTSLFLDADGVIRAIYVGQLSKELLREYVAAASEGTTAGEPPAKTRLITTVARDHTLVVRDLGDGRLEFASKSLRCDDTYCSDPAIAALADAGGTDVIERYLDEDPARIVVSSDAVREEVAQALADALTALGDPLYERPLEIVYR
ncbi:MAG: TlpA disulfide reductase family protein [Dehalococcoidia bacterium]